jgi:hypothetical protein
MTEWEWLVWGFLTVEPLASYGVYDLLYINQRAELMAQFTDEETEAQKAHVSGHLPRRLHWDSIKVPNLRDQVAHGTTYVRSPLTNTPTLPYRQPHLPEGCPHLVHERKRESRHFCFVYFFLAPNSEHSVTPDSLQILPGWMDPKSSIPFYPPSFATEVKIDHKGSHYASLQPQYRVLPNGTSLPHLKLHDGLPFKKRNPQEQVPTLQDQGHQVGKLPSLTPEQSLCRWGAKPG